MAEPLFRLLILLSAHLSACLYTGPLQLEEDMHIERQRASSDAHKLGDEAKRLAAQCVELQRELQTQNKEVARLKVGRWVRQGAATACLTIDGWLKKVKLPFRLLCCGRGQCG